MFELINLGMSTFGGGAMTMVGNVINNIPSLDSVTNLINTIGTKRLENKKENNEQSIKEHEANEKSSKGAREFKGTEGYHKTRQWIAKTVIVTYFVLPFVLPFIGALVGVPFTVSYGYYDIFQKWPWSESVEVVKWITIGNEGGIPMLIHPVMNNVVISIVGMFFGNQMVKK